MSVVLVDPTLLTREAAELRLKANRGDLMPWERESLLAQADQKVAAVNLFYDQMREEQKRYDFAEIIRGDLQLTLQQKLCLIGAALAVGVLFGTLAVIFL